jgi:dipeptidyl aminopeptidase/acylaminoacyl peptidase
VFAHPTLDVAAVGSLGKHERIVSATYIEDRPCLHFFDERTEQIQTLLARQFPDQLTAVIDEDWNERFYLVYTSSDRDPGSYYRLDTQTPTLLLLSQAYPALAKRELASMQSIRHAADDGTPIPAYLTLPVGRSAENLPAIVLPHGGPSSRDYWSYDFLVQFLVSQGYAVLQS